SDMNDKLNRELAEDETKIAELERMVTNLSRESQDKRELLESIQSDKETISKALQQNKELKEQLGQLETRFVEMVSHTLDCVKKFIFEGKVLQNYRPFRMDHCLRKLIFVAIRCAILHYTFHANRLF
ncbi:golgin subfamily A member 2 isoform X2, partial [Paramuricea clavata]